MASHKDDKKPKESFITLMNRRPIAVEYTFNLSDIEFDQEKNLLMFLETLRNSTSQDIVRIYCSSNGGSVYVALRILNAMQDSEALIITMADSYVHSAASLILLSGDIIEVKGYCDMLVHDVNSVLGGKSSTMSNEISFQQEWKLDIFTKCYLGFLTKEEIKLLSEGKDYRFQSKEILERLHKLAAYKLKHDGKEIIIYDKKKFTEDSLKAMKDQDEQVIEELKKQEANEKKETKKKSKKKPAAIDAPIIVEAPKPPVESKKKKSVKKK